MKRIALLLPLALVACSYEYIIEPDDGSSTTGTTGTTTATTGTTTTTGNAPGSGGSGAGDEGGGGSSTVTTSSGGGAGGGGSDGGGGGAGGGDVCVIADDCPQPEGECQIATCEDDGTGRLVCGIADRPDGTLVGAQIPGDCKVRVCIGGVVTEDVPADDPPTDAGCLDYSCDDDGTVVSTAVEVGTPCVGGVCQTGIYAGQCGLSLYSRSFPGAGSWTRQALSAAWTGANAPPPTSTILVAEETSSGSHLMVIRSDGTYYEYKNGAWQVPRPATEVFTGLPSTQVSALVAGSFFGDELLNFVTVGPNPVAYSYRLIGGAEPVTPSVPLSTAVTDEQRTKPNAPPQHNTTMTWAIGEQRGPYGQSEDAHVTWKSLLAIVYENWAGTDPGFYYPVAPVAEATSPFGLNGANNAPAAGTISAGFYRNANNTVFFIAP